MGWLRGSLVCGSAVIGNWSGGFFELEVSALVVSR